jgi:predicted nucleotidyltransferase
MASGDESHLLSEALARGAAELADADAVILFGSWARGRARADSDVDVAVLMRQRPHASERLALSRCIVTTLAKQVAADRLHVVILNDAPPVLAFEVLRFGRVIVCRDPVALHRFRVRTYRMRADYEHVERLFRQRTAQMARHG